MPQIIGMTNVPALKAALRIAVTVTTDDGLLRDLVDAANEALTNAINRNVLSANYTETRDGTGTKTLMLKNYPVTAVSSVQILSPGVVSPLPTSLVQGTDYLFTPYALKMYAGVWPKAVGNVVVSYTGGYAAMPPDLARAATKYAAMRYRELERLGQKSKMLGGETISYDLDEFPPDVLGVVNRYSTGIGLVDDSIL